MVVVVVVVVVAVLAQLASSLFLLSTIKWRGFLCSKTVFGSSFELNNTEREKILYDLYRHPIGENVMVQLSMIISCHNCTNWDPGKIPSFSKHFTVMKWLVWSCALNFCVFIKLLHLRSTMSHLPNTIFLFSY